MQRITIYRHPNCAKCRKIARMHQRCDWFKRIKVSTDTPPTGPLRQGEIVVEDHQNGNIIGGVDAVSRIAREIPLYAPFRLLLGIPAIARAVDKDVRGCGDGRCELPTTMNRNSTRKESL